MLSMYFCENIRNIISVSDDIVILLS